MEDSECFYGIIHYGEENGTVARNRMRKFFQYEYEIIIILLFYISKYQIIRITFVYFPAGNWIVCDIEINVCV